MRARRGATRKCSQGVRDEEDDRQRQDHMLAAAVLAVAMLRARVLPRLPIMLFGVAGSVGLVVTCVGVALGLDMGNDIALGVSPVELGSAVTACGLAWLGWVLAREHVLDTPAATPLATT